MFLTKTFIPILVLVFYLTATIVAQVDEGSVVSQNPLIEGEEVLTDDPDMMFSPELEDGDVELTETQKSEYKNEALGRQVGSKSKYRWPKSLNGQTVLIPYVIQGGVYCK